LFGCGPSLGVGLFAGTIRSFTPSDDPRFL
jgi:hypothetical protein